MESHVAIATEDLDIIRFVVQRVTIPMMSLQVLRCGALFALRQSIACLGALPTTFGTIKFCRLAVSDIAFLSAVNRLPPVTAEDGRLTEQTWFRRSDWTGSPRAHLQLAAALIAAGQPAAILIVVLQASAPVARPANRLSANNTWPGFVGFTLGHAHPFSKVHANV